jgi:NitT/TauT family transport system permease protein
MRPRAQAAAVRLALIIGLVAALEIGCRTGVIPRITMVPPSDMVVSAAHALIDPALRQSILITLQELILAALLATFVGASVGLCLFAAPSIRRLADPILNAWYAVPIFIFYPVMIVFFGIGQRAIVAISFVFAVAAMILSTLAALDRIPIALFKVARLHRLGIVRSVVFVLLPAALPNLVVGLRLVLAYSLVATIGAEFILSSTGLGHEISFSYDNFQTKEMYGLILIVIVAAILLNALLSMMVQFFGDQEQEGRVRRG